MINVYELQPTSTSPLDTVSSFPMPFHTDSSFPVWSPDQGRFSFSPVSFHASFVTRTEFIIVDVQSSQLLLQTKVAQVDYTVPPQFSANGCFVAYKTLKEEVCIWENGPTGYVPWCSLRARLSFKTFLFSPTSLSVLCWGQDLKGIQLLCPDNCLSPPSPNEAESHYQDGNHLVAYSADEVHIAIAKQGYDAITILDFLLGTPQQVINTDMRIKDIKIIDNTVFVTDGHKLVSWELEAAGVEDCGYSTGRVINESLAIDSDAKCLRLSHDCSQIAYATETKMGVAIYNIQAQETLQHTPSNLWVRDIWFSPSDHQLWFIGGLNPYSFQNFYIRRLMIEDGFDDWSSESQGDYAEVGWSWANHFSYGYHVKMDSEWVTDSRGSKLLWLLPAWRTQNWMEVRWDGRFLALLGGYHPKPIIIEFQP